MSYLDLPEFRDVRDNVLIEYLCPADLYNITPNIEIIKKCLIYHINTRLKDIFGDTYDKFKQTLDDNNILISGSFILQCILGVHWESDIDIVTFIDRNREERLDYLPDNQYLFPFMEFLNRKDDHFVDYDYLNNTNVSSIVDYNFNGRNIQVVSYPVYIANDFLRVSKRTNELTKKEFIEASYSNILKNYDFDVCMNIFYVENGKDNVEIGHLDSILKKIINVTESNIYSRVKRIVKYKNRGFKFNDEKLDNIRDIIEPNTKGPRLLIINDEDDENYFEDLVYTDINTIGIYEIFAYFGTRNIFNYSVLKDKRGYGSSYMKKLK